MLLAESNRHDLSVYSIWKFPSNINQVVVSIATADLKVLTGKQRDGGRNNWPIAFLPVVPRELTGFIAGGLLQRQVISTDNTKVVEFVGGLMVRRADGSHIPYGLLRHIVHEK